MSHSLEKAQRKEKSRRIRHPQTREQKKQRLVELTNQQEEDLCPNAVHTMTRKLNQQIYQPTLRQKLFGFRPGRLGKEDRDFLQVMEVMQEMKKALKSP